VRWNDDKYSQYGYDIALLHKPSLDDFKYLEFPVQSTLLLLTQVQHTFATIVKDTDDRYSDKNQRIVTFSDEMTLAMLTRFEMFMYLKRKYPKQLLVPTMDIEFVWQCLLLKPSKYLDYRNDDSRIS